MKALLFPSSLVLAMMLAGPALADDAPGTSLPCNSLCRAWLALGRHDDTPPAAPEPAATPEPVAGSEAVTAPEPVAEAAVVLPPRRPAYLRHAGKAMAKPVRTARAPHVPERVTVATSGIKNGDPKPPGFPLTAPPSGAAQAAPAPALPVEPSAPVTTAAVVAPLPTPVPVQPAPTAGETGSQPAEQAQTSAALAPPPATDRSWINLHDQAPVRIMAALSPAPALSPEATQPEAKPPTSASDVTPVGSTPASPDARSTNTRPATASSDVAVVPLD